MAEQLSAFRAGDVAWVECDVRCHILPLVGFLVCSVSLVFLSAGDLLGVCGRAENDVLAMAVFVLSIASFNNEDAPWRPCNWGNPEPGGFLYEILYQYTIMKHWNQ